jgi:WD40 repeat protein
MAQVRRHRRAIAVAVTALAALVAPALAQGPSAGADLFDRPVLAVDPGMHTAPIWAQAVDAAGRFAVTASADRTLRIWSVADGKLLRTIWVPAGPENVGAIEKVAISPDGSTIAAGGYTERLYGDMPIYLFERESGNLIKRIGGDLPSDTKSLTFSPDGRFLAAALDTGQGLRVFDRDKDWSEVFRDDQYGDSSHGAAFARDGRLATTCYDGLIRLYQYDPTNERPNFRRVGEPVRAPSGLRPHGVAFSPDGKLLAVGYAGGVAVDILNGTTLALVGGHRPANAAPAYYGSTEVAWSRDGQVLFADGAVQDDQGQWLLLAWNRHGMGDERRMTYCAATNGAAGVDALPDGRIFVASPVPCLSLIDARGEAVWTISSPILDYRAQVDNLRVSQDGNCVDFGYVGSAEPGLRFDVRSLTLSSSRPNECRTFAPLREGIPIQR